MNHFKKSKITEIEIKSENVIPREIFSKKIPSCKIDIHDLKIKFIEFYQY
jgi:hypothetical protein